MVGRERPARARLQDWPERLAELVEARRTMAFAWGGNDCCLFAADAVLAMTGADPAAAFRGYASEDEAARLIRDGLEEVVAAALAEFGAGACHPAFVQRGDLALVLMGNQPTVTVVLGATVAGPGPDGLVFLPAGAVLRAWSI